MQTFGENFQESETLYRNPSVPFSLVCLFAFLTSQRQGQGVGAPLHMLDAIETTAPQA